MRVIPWITDGSVNFVVEYIHDFTKREILEHDAAWHKKVRQTVALNGAINVENYLLNRPYSAKPSEIVRDRKFDIILIDGRDRMECLREILRLNALENGGITAGSRQSPGERAIRSQNSNWGPA